MDDLNRPEFLPIFPKEFSFQVLHLEFLFWKCGWIHLLAFLILLAIQYLLILIVTSKLIHDSVDTAIVTVTDRHWNPSLIRDHDHHHKDQYGQKTWYLNQNISFSWHLRLLRCQILYPIYVYVLETFFSFRFDDDYVILVLVCAPSFSCDNN